MISYSNIHKYDKLDFAHYLALPGYSHSFLKREVSGITDDLAITDNITTGKLVDAILTDHTSADMTDPIYQIAKDIAYEIHKAFGSFIKQFHPQVSYTAIMESNGFFMPVKGRLDWLLNNHAVIDLKVTKSKNVSALINHMGYMNQVWHYARLACVKNGYLMIYSVPLRKTEIIKVNCSGDTNPFWEDKLIKFGTVKETV